MNSLQPTPDTSANPDRSATIRQLNDAFRQTFTGGKVLITSGITALPDATRVAILAAVQAFDRFDPDNDPYGEHDFGAVTVDGVRCLWKIDAFDRALRLYSPDPADPAQTRRVMVIMLADEY